MPEPKNPKKSAPTIVGASVETQASLASLPLALSVRAVGQPSRCRIGRRFTAEPTLIQASEIDEAQYLALTGDPLLAVELQANEPEAPAS